MYDKFIKYISKTDKKEKLLSEFKVINNIITNELNRRYLDLKLLKEMSYKLAIISDKLIKDKIESDNNET